ncbi:5-formyltetrahydrofolate cyclo-ligase [Ruegeria sp. MALMAid1280]|uniref:5-formyltetrahydrofolate cyclo-ligase n=1 Tax=Ruegeria sp. MALMAid1280 TaxID=3411634 RepID=UPI003B9E0F00
MSSADEDRQGQYASSPCMAHEIAPNYFDPMASDPEQERDVARWRRAERTRLRNARHTLSVEMRRQVGQTLCRNLSDFLDERFDGACGRVLSAYWPIKAEPDLRPLMTQLHEAGCIIALPIVEQKAAPLVFRRWAPGTRMVRGDWNIPVPPPSADRLIPDIVLAPVIGWDPTCYRLGYGGGYFDRTLANLAPRPYCIGVGYQSAELRTIYPQPHDIPLDVIVTEAGIAARRDAHQSGSDR